MKSLSESRQIQSQQKIQGIIFIQNTNQSSPNNQLIELKSNQQLILHSYKKFKSFPYTFDYIYKQSQSEGFYSNTFRQFNAIDSIRQGLDYLLFCTGVSAKSKKQIPEVQLIFYQQLSAILQNLRKVSNYTFQINVLGVSQESIVDLVNGNIVQVREIETKNGRNSELLFNEATISQPETPYQIIQLIKSTLAKKNKVLPLSYYVMYLEVNLTENKQNKRKVLLINATKDSQGYKKLWDNKTNLVLNKCILAIIHKIENSKQISPPFRDSKLTRIMKPFLSSYSKIDNVGFLNSYDEQSSYHTLNLVKNLSQMKFSHSKISHIQNPELGNSRLADMMHSKVMASKDRYELNKKFKTQQIQDHPVRNKKVDLFQKIRDHFNEQVKVEKKLQQIRRKLKVVKMSKQMNLIKLNNEQQLQLSRSLEDNQIQYQIQKEKQLLDQAQKLNKMRIQTIQKSTSVTQKLKLLKQYYTLAKTNQKQEANQFLRNQSHLNKFYEQKISLIDKQLKKSPMELLMPLKKSIAIKDEIKSAKPEKSQKIYLPDIMQKKRLSLIKQKIKKGRVQYQSFLSKNISQYQSYATTSND